VNQGESRWIQERLVRRLVRVWRGFPALQRRRWEVEMAGGVGWSLAKQAGSGSRARPGGANGGAGEGCCRRRNPGLVRGRMRPGCTLFRFMRAGLCRKSCECRAKLAENSLENVYSRRRSHFPCNRQHREGISVSASSENGKIRVTPYGLRIFVRFSAGKSRIHWGTDGRNPWIITKFDAGAFRGSLDPSRERLRWIRPNLIRIFLPKHPRSFGKTAKGGRQL